uniref:protein-disulfide reductase n=1 Tax=Pristionchus pacificus TaxID=54126 RepID=A0A8R1YLS2_PRIPA
MRLLAGISNIMKNGVRKVHFLDGLTMHKRGIEKIENGYFDNKALLIYFSSSWCPSCKLFTPKLKRVYEEANREKDTLEVLWVSRDRSDEQLHKYYNSKLPPFVYFPFGSQEIAKFLSQYEIKTIPAIRLVDSTGSVVSDNIRIQIENCDTGDVSKLLSEWKNVSND